MLVLAQHKYATMCSASAPNISRLLDLTIVSAPEAASLPLCPCISVLCRCPSCPLPNSPCRCLLALQLLLTSHNCCLPCSNHCIPFCATHQAATTAVANRYPPS